MKTFKKIFCLFYLFLFTLSSIPKESLAQQTYPYVFDAKAQGTQITVTLSGVPAADRGKANIFIEPLNTFPIGLVCPIGSSDIKCAASVQPTKTISQNGTITWTRSASVSGGSIYYIRAEIDFGGTRAPYISAVKWVVTGAETVDAKWPLTYGKECNPSTIIGKLNNTNKADFTITIQYAGTAMPADESTPAGASGPIQSVNGINEDGTYSFILQNLEKNTQYFVKQIIRSKNGALDIKTDKFKTCQGYIPAGSNDEANDFNKRSYRLLAPISEKLQIVLDQDLCQEYVNEGKLQPGSCDNQISDFLNIILQILIGLAVVMLVVQIILKGYEYMVTDTPFKKTAAKSRIMEAAAGLLLALSAYVILNTINPRLVSPDINISKLDIGVESFDISGAATFDGKPIKVDLKKEAYPAAKIASQKTGVDIAFILAMFQQESGSGSNSGNCLSTQSNMRVADYQYLNNELIPLINSEYPNKTKLVKDSVNVSCTSKTSTGGAGDGGAIGYTQFMPTTWKEYRESAKSLLGHEPYPWDTGDALMMTALFLKNKGGAINNEASQEQAACKYFGTCTRSNGKPWLISCSGEQKTYGQCVIGKKKYYQQVIDDAIKKGEAWVK